MPHQSESQLGNTKPTKEELIFLNLAYNRFYDFYEKLESRRDSLRPEERFSLLVNIFQIYSECLKYQPIQLYLKFLEKRRPSGDIISLRYFEVIRHILVHFPFFNKWDDVYFTRDLIIWNSRHSSIDSFFSNNEGKAEYKWRIWDSNKRVMKYGYVLRFPQDYRGNSKIYIKDLIDENEGIEICLLMIKKVLESQVEHVK